MRDNVNRSDAAKPLALGGISVVELGQGVAAAFAAKLMALMGASVIKVESPEGDVTRHRGPFPGDIPNPEKSGLFQYLNADKRGITLDLRNRADRRALDDLLNGADIMIHNIAPYNAPPADWKATPSAATIPD